MTSQVIAVLWSSAYGEGVEASPKETVMKRSASAHWQGSTKEGTGTISVQSGTLRDTPYSFKARFGDGKGTNPEELIAAAHAGCFTMALSFAITSAGFVIESIDSDVVLTMDDVDGKPTITAVQLRTRARVPGVDAARFAALANEAKAGCLVSRALSPSILVTLDAALA
jgi:osmotically inducible protein OsmC